jgi:hypothetical protein
MYKRSAIACLFALTVIAFLGCEAKDKTSEATEVANAVASSDSTSSFQYMAVCTTTEAHEGNEYVLTKWLDSKYKAEVYGREHSRKRKGHEVVYRERAKP